jgi:hypothetical protein
MHNTLHLLVVLFLVACVPEAVSTADQVQMECVEICTQEAELCGIILPSYDPGDCESPCERDVSVSEVDPEVFCLDDMEWTHFAACQHCLLTGSDEVCDFSRQFDPENVCYEVCLYGNVDVAFCGHIDH